MLLKYEADIEAAHAAGYDLRRQGRHGPTSSVDGRCARICIVSSGRRAAPASHVSPAESIDAMRAVAEVGFADRGHPARHAAADARQERRTKSSALGDCFDLFFSQPEPRQDQPEADSETTPEDADQRRRPATASDASGGAPAPQSSGPLAQMLLSQDRNAIAAAMASAAECRLAVRHPLLHPARHLLQPHPRRAWASQRLRDDLDALTATNPALAERLRGRARCVARKRARHRRAGACALWPRGSRKPAQRDPAQRAARPHRARAMSSEMRALIRQIARRLRERYTQAAQAPAPRPSRRPPHAAPQRRLGRRSLPHRLEAQAPRPAEDRGALRRLGLGGAGLRLLPAPDPLACTRWWTTCAPSPSPAI